MGNLRGILGESWKYEVEALMSSQSFTDEQILLGDRVRRLRHGASLDYVLNQLEADYGSLESRDNIMRQFYSSQ